MEKDVAGKKITKEEEWAREAKAKKRKLIPPFVMLFAGAVSSITMRILHYDTGTMLTVLLCVLLCFYIAGCLIKRMLDKFEAQIEEANMEEGEVIEKELVAEDELEQNLQSDEKE